MDTVTLPTLIWTENKTVILLKLLSLKTLLNTYYYGGSKFIADEADELIDNVHMFLMSSSFIRQTGFYLIGLKTSSYIHTAERP